MLTYGLGQWGITLGVVKQAALKKDKYLEVKEVFRNFVTAFLTFKTEHNE